MVRRKAFAGSCSLCGQRTIRGEDQNGDLAVVGLGDHTAADELRAWMAGRQTYRSEWVGYMQLNKREPHDLRIDPAGFRPGRIYAAHVCLEEPDDAEA